MIHGAGIRVPPAWLLLIPLAAVAVVVAGCDAVRPIEQVCDKRLGPTAVNVTATPVEYTTDLTKPGAELKQMGAFGGTRLVLGLTHAKMQTSVRFKPNAITNRVSRKVCMRPVVDVELSFAPMTVYIANENAEGSCPFGMTMQHELQHVAVFRDFLDQAAIDVERDLREYFGTRIQYFASEAEAEKKMAADMKERLGPYVEQTMGRVVEAQAKLDTREEYDRLSRMCGGY